MSKRGGPPIKLIVIAATLLGCVYLLYLYNSTQGRLREAEASAERYRRSDESKVAQLQDSMKEKELLQEKCENDRQEFVNRLNSLNSQHKMLKGQHDELEAENGRLQQDMQKARDDNANIEAQHRQEFSQMKQEKELEIASLRDQIANIQRQNDNLQNEISSLKAQLENSQQNAAAAANAQNQQPQQQNFVQQPNGVQQQQNFVQQQNGVQQQQNIAQQEQNIAQQEQNLLQQQQAQQAAQQAIQQAAQINQPGGIQPNDLVYQAQGQGQFQGQGQGQGQGQEAVQNMNQNVNQDFNNLNMNVGAQVPNAGQDPNNQNQMAAGDLVQGQGQVQGQEGVNNEQHQMRAPNMDGVNQGAANQNNKTAVGHHNPAEGGQTEKPLDDLKPLKDKALEVKHNTTLAPKSKLDSIFGDDAAIKTQKKESFKDKLLGLKQIIDGDVIDKEGHADDVKVVDVFDNLKVDPGKPQEVKEKASGNNTDHMVPGHDEQAVGVEMNAPKSPENEGNTSKKEAVDMAVNATKLDGNEGNASQKQAVGLAVNPPKSPENEESESQKQAVGVAMNAPKSPENEGNVSQKEAAGLAVNAPKAPENEGNKTQKEAVGVALNAPKSPENEGNVSQKEAVEEKPKIDTHQEAIQQQAQGQDQVADVVMQAQAPQAPQAPQNEGEAQKQGIQDVHPDVMANQGQIFKPDFNNQVVADNKLQVDAQDNQLGLNHDNRIQNEGPVNLQVQEPLLPNRNFDEDKHIPQQQLPPRNDADLAGNEAPPLQPQGQGQMMIPNFGLGKNMGKVFMDGDVQVEGEEEEEEEDEEQYNDDNVDKYEMDDTADKDTLQEQMDV